MEERHEPPSLVDDLQAPPRFVPLDGPERREDVGWPRHLNLGPIVGDCPTGKRQRQPQPGQVLRDARERRLQTEGVAHAVKAISRPARPPVGLSLSERRVVPWSVGPQPQNSHGVLKGVLARQVHAARASVHPWPARSAPRAPDTADDLHHVGIRAEDLGGLCWRHSNGTKTLAAAQDQVHLLLHEGRYCGALRPLARTPAHDEKLMKRVRRSPQAEHHKRRLRITPRSGPTALSSWSPNRRSSRPSTSPSRSTRIR
jgi:hypothetical protein